METFWIIAKPALGIALLAVNFFYVLAEFALVRLRGSRVSELIEGGDPRARVVQRIQGDMDSYLSVVQVGITGATLGIGVLIEDAIAAPIVKLIGASTPFFNGLAHASGFLIATFLVILTSELLPKSIAIRYAEPCALVCARPMVWSFRVLYPLLWLLTRSAQGLMRMLGLRRGTEDTPHSEDELRILLDQSQEHGLMSFRRLLFMENIFEFGELRVKDAMRPRSQARCLVADLHINDLFQFLDTWPYSRFPLITDDPNKPIGFIHIKDLFYHKVYHQAMTGAPIDLRKLVRPLSSVLDTASLESVLAEFQRRRQAMALVVNAEGAWVGLVTLEDILEELVGTITDEFEREPPLTLAEHLTPGRIILDAQGPNLAEVLRQALAKVPPNELPLPVADISKAVMERERLAGTYLGKGIALPHARLAGIDRGVLLIIRPVGGLPVDGSSERAKLLFVLLTPQGQPRIHQRLQARIAGLVENSTYVEERLLDARSSAEVLEIIRTGEAAALD